MAESEVPNGNEVETICDSTVMLYINSVTKQLVTEIIINVQLIDFLNRSVSLNELRSSVVTIGSA